MTVGDLCKQLFRVRRDAIIVLPAADHCYRRATVDALTAIEYDRHILSEDFGDEHNEPGGKRVHVLLFS